MMKKILCSAVFLTIAASGLQARADERFPDTSTVRKATRAMLQSCKSGFADIMPGMSVNDVDHWAEAQENAASVISTPFKKTPCYSTHETWEKLVHRNEWAGSRDNDSTRAPASADQGGKLIDGSRPVSWNGDDPVF